MMTKSSPQDKPALVQEHEAKGKHILLKDGQQSIFVRDEGGQKQQSNDHPQTTVVMIHGVPASSLLYRKFFDPLVAKGYRALALDLPGCGLSSKPLDRDYSWPAMAQTLAGVLHHEDILGSTTATTTTKVHLVIHDIGGPVGAIYACEHPDRVASITVLDTVFDVETFRKPFPMFFFPMPVIGTIAVKMFTPWITRQFMYMRGVQDRTAFDSQEAAAWVWMLQNNNGHKSFLKIMKSFPQTKAEKTALTQQFKRVLADQQPVQQQQQQQQHKIPMQIVWAQGDIAIPQYQCQYIQDNFDVEQKYVHKVPGRHFFQLESSDIIVQHIHDFLQEQQEQQQ